MSSVWSPASSMALTTPGSSRAADPGTASGYWEATRPTANPNDRQALDLYMRSVIHEWSRTLAGLGTTLIPLSFLLDWVLAPPELLGRFTAYRAAATALVVAQALVLKATHAGPLSYLHGYFFSVVVASMISAMTTDLGGFNSTYYAGLSLVMVAVNLMLPWRAIHSAFNSLLVIAIYVTVNLTRPSPEPVHLELAVNNLYFLVATAVVSVAINFVKEKLIRQEFFGRRDLKDARDALWSEMAVAKRIQTSLLPRVQRLPGWEVAAVMLPADEVGGDYYDVMVNDAGELWVAIGDVSGHGVESGLIMMMTQTSVATAVSQSSGLLPSAVLRQVNRVITENIARLRADRYMSLTAMVVRGDQLVFAGKHQDFFVWRADEGRVERVETWGTWLGVTEALGEHVRDDAVRLGPRDVVLLFTDGVTEASNVWGRMYGQERLQQLLQKHAGLELEELVRRIVRDVSERMAEQTDDLTLLAFTRRPEGGR